MMKITFETNECWKVTFRPIKSTWSLEPSEKVFTSYEECNKWILENKDKYREIIYYHIKEIN